MLSISNLKKEYSGRTVLDIDSLEIHQGKRYALLGANGSGKSTLLKLLAGIIKPSQGVISTALEGAKAVGYLPQTAYGFSFSVLRNVLMATDGSVIQQQSAKDALAAVGMTALTNANASKLSGGETQRMAFARMIAVPRKLLLLDEPTAAADLAGIDLLEAALLQYCSTHDCTVVFATHSPAQAMRIANEVIFLYQGRIAEQGEARQVLYYPEHEETRSFMNHWKL